MKAPAFAAVFCLLLVSGARAQSDSPSNMQEAMAAAAEMFKAFQGAGSGAAPSVDFRKLRELFPEEIGGLQRTNTSGEKTGAFGAQISMAQTEYRGGDDAMIAMKITDYGPMGALTAFANMAFLGAEIDREGDDGYERTTEFSGWRGIEKYDGATKSGSVQTAVANRFLVEINGTNITADQLQKASGAIDFKKLEALTVPEQ